VYWRCGDKPRARALLKAMKERPDATDHGYRIATIHTLLSEKDSAFAWLDHQRWTLGQLAGLGADEWYESLRTDPRYRQLLQHLGVRRGQPSIPRANRPPDSSTLAYVRQLYEHGHHAQRSRSFAQMQTAIRYYRQAIDRDPNFALAYASLSEAYALEAHYDFAPKRIALDSARLAAERAVEIDSTLPEAHGALGLSLGNDGKFREAEVEFRTAIGRAPRNSLARYWYSMLLVALGRGKEALVQIDSVFMLDSFPPRAAWGTRRDALFLLSGKHDASASDPRDLQPILRQEAEPWAMAQSALTQAERGECNEARAGLREALQLVPDSNLVMLGFAGATYLACGEQPLARGLLARMKQRTNASDHGLRIALLHMRLGERDSAFVWLKRHRWLMSELTMLRGDRLLDAFREDARYAQLLRQLGVANTLAGKDAATTR